MNIKISVFSLFCQVVFASICTNFWECGLVAIDDITVSMGDCQIKAGHSVILKYGMKYFFSELAIFYF